MFEVYTLIENWHNNGEYEDFWTDMTLKGVFDSYENALDAAKQRCMEIIARARKDVEREHEAEGYEIPSLYKIHETFEPGRACALLEFETGRGYTEADYYAFEVVKSELNKAIVCEEEGDEDED